MKKQRKVLGKLVRSSLGVKLPIAMKIGKLLHERSTVPVPVVLKKLTEMGVTYETDDECRCGECTPLTYVDTLVYREKSMDLRISEIPSLRYMTL